MLTDIYSDLTWRGLLHQATDPEKIPAWLQQQPRTLYAGFDPTADSLHVGHLVALMTLRRFQKAGHRPIALIGGATGMIGDPSGKSQERNLLDVASLEVNVAGMRSQVEVLLDFSGPQGALLVNNFDWMKGYSFLNFLRDVGKCFPVNVMLAKDSVKSRLEGSDSGLSYTEFSYMLLQAYDFVHLHQTYGCELQIGGSDQWGNITAGIDLARRMHGVHLHGMTSPLLTKADGTKMGKTEGGAVWLSPTRTSPYAFYQYWFNVADAEVGKCLRYFTELSHDELTALDESRQQDPGRRESQRRLAEDVTRLIHGEVGLSAARRASEILFGAEIDKLSDQELQDIFADVPSQQLTPDRLDGEGLNIIDALISSGLSKSKSDARRTIENGGAYVNNRRIEGFDTQLGRSHLATKTVMVLRSGKKRYALIKFTAAD